MFTLDRRVFTATIHPRNLVAAVLVWGLPTLRRMVRDAPICPDRLLASLRVCPDAGNRVQDGTPVAPASSGRWLLDSSVILYRCFLPCARLRTHGPGCSIDALLGARRNARRSIFAGGAPAWGLSLVRLAILAIWLIAVPRLKEERRIRPSRCGDRRAGGVDFPFSASTRPQARRHGSRTPIPIGSFAATSCHPRDPASAPAQPFRNHLRRSGGCCRSWCRTVMSRHYSSRATKRVITSALYPAVTVLLAGVVPERRLSRCS